ncbi:MAG: amidohydrolase family protein [Acidobacteriota bacterium]
MRKTCLIFALSLAAAGSVRGREAQQRPNAPTAQAGPTALVGGTLIDGVGGPPIRNSVVLIRGDRIEKIGVVGSLAVPSGYEQISTDGMTVLPGLWDLHVHLLYGGHPNARYWFETYASQFERVTIPASAEQMLMAGVTSVRDLGAPKEILSVKKRIENGEIPGPTLYVAGPVLVKGGAPSVHLQSVAGPDDARTKTRQLIDAGVDWIKLINAEQWTPEELKAVVTEAHLRGRRVAAHAFTDSEVRLGLAAGVDDFQHLRTQTPEYPADIAASIRERVRTGPPLYWTITAGGNGQLNAAYLASNPEFLDDPANFIGLPKAIADDVRRGIAGRISDVARGTTPGGGAAAGRGRGGQTQEDINAFVKRKVAQIRQLGVEIVFGTDIGSWGEVTGQATWMEADLWVRELGMDPMSVLRKMTLDAARVMGADHDSGSVTEGKYADVIAVRGDPLRHIDVLRDPKLVIKHGRRYK